MSKTKCCGSRVSERVHNSHCYQGEYEDSCKYGDRDCPAKPKEDNDLDIAIRKYNSKNLVHFIDGWKMYPNWWATSTESWKLGFLARKVKDSKVTLFAVYTQYEPTHKYEPYLDSIWSSVEEAREHAEKATTDDWVWIEEIALNKEFLTVEEGFREMVKDPRSVKK